MPEAPEGYIKVGDMKILRIKKCVSVSDGSQSIAVFYSDGQLYAFSNLCPHSGYALETGSIKDGLLTCAWHQARFDVADGTCPDGFTDDIDTYDVVRIDDEVWVNPEPR